MSSQLVHCYKTLDVVSLAASFMPISFISTRDLQQEAAIGGSSNSGLYLRQQDLDLVKEIR